MGWWGRFDYKGAAAEQAENNRSLNWGLEMAQAR